MLEILQWVQNFFFIINEWGHLFFWKLLKINEKRFKVPVFLKTVTGKKIYRKKLFLNYNSVYAHQTSAKLVHKQFFSSKKGWSPYIKKKTILKSFQVNAVLDIFEDIISISNRWCKSINQLNSMNNYKRISNTIAVGISSITQMHCNIVICDFERHKRPTLAGWNALICVWTPLKLISRHKPFDGIWMFLSSFSDG